MTANLACFIVCLLRDEIVLYIVPTLLLKSKLMAITIFFIKIFTS